MWRSRRCRSLMHSLRRESRLTLRKHRLCHGISLGRPARCSALLNSAATTRLDSTHRHPAELREPPRHRRSGYRWLKSNKSSRNKAEPTAGVESRCHGQPERPSLLLWSLRLRGCRPRVHAPLHPPPHGRPQGSLGPGFAAGAASGWLPRRCLPRPAHSQRFLTLKVQVQVCEEESGTWNILGRSCRTPGLPVRAPSPPLSRACPKRRAGAAPAPGATGDLDVCVSVTAMAPILYNLITWKP